MTRSLRVQVCLTGIGVTLALMANCNGGGGGGGGNGGGKGAPDVTVAITTPSAAAVSVAVNQNLSIVATVTGNCSGAGCGVNWTVNGIVGGNSTFGTIGTGDMPNYQAPATVPNPATFAITATSVAESTSTATIMVTITAAPVAVSITSPSSLMQNVEVGGTLPITASLTGTSNTAVNWTVNGVASGNSTYGLISGTGLSITYDAPSSIPSPATFNVTATSAADNTKSASVSVTIVSGVVVAIASPSGSTYTLPIDKSLAISASVTGSSNTTVTWTVNGVTNGNATFGTINGLGLSVTYEAPSAVPSPATFKVTATSQADNAKSASINVTISSGVTIAITNPASSSQNVAVSATLPLSASVSGTTNTAVTWTVNGVTNGGPAYGTISGSGLSVTFTAPPAVPTPDSYDIVVTSAEDTSKTATLMVTVTSASAACGSGNESVLNGQYAFNLIGYNSSGFQAVVGSLTADGSGHITGGEADSNSTPGPHNTGAVSASTYSVGSDNRGCATIVTSFGTFNTRFQLGGVSSGVATAGHLMEFDAPNASAYVASGQILQQVTADFSAGLSGGYSHFLQGWDSSATGRIVCGGVHTNSGGNVSDSEQTCNDKGTITHTGPDTGNVGTYSSIDSHGRFTETVNSSDIVGYAVYSGGTPGVPSALTLTTDANPVLAGEAIHQTGTFGAGSLNGVYAVYANGVNNSTSGKIFFALYAGDGVGTLTQDAYYENDGGTWVAGNAAASYSFSVDQYGDTTLSTNTVPDAGHLYLSGDGWAVYIGTDTGSFGGFGASETESGAFSNSTLDGTFFGGTTEVVNHASEVDGEIAILNGAGGVSLTEDIASTGSQQVGQTNAVTVTVAANGTFTGSSDPSQVIGLVIDANYFLVANNPTSSYPTILLFGPGTAP